MTVDRAIWLAVAICLGAATSAGCQAATPNGRAAAPAARNEPDGAAAFKASRHAFGRLQQLTLDRTTTTDLGVFREISEVDCVSPYYHSRYTKDLTAKGLDANTTQLQGRPRAHQEEEKLFVDGASFYRFTGSWEAPAPGSDDAHPEWKRANQSYDPAPDCEAFRQGKAIPFMPFDSITTANRIEYQGRRAAAGSSCDEFKVTYPDLISDMRKPEPVESTICLGVDDFLPRHGTKREAAFTFSYGSLRKLTAP